jgi:hypothetical protein
MDEDIVNVEFYVEIAFLEEWLANPKYESEYGKDTIIAAEETMKKTIEVVEVVAALKEE